MSLFRVVSLLAVLVTACDSTCSGGCEPANGTTPTDTAARNAKTLLLSEPPAAVTLEPLPASGPGTNYAVDDPFTAARTQWWRDGRFGMFIHFGAYSHLQGEYTRSDGTLCRNAEWIERECEIPTAEYERLAADFNPAGFDAEAIAQAAADAGQRYVVITAKHHEGYAMWPTKVNNWNLRDHSAFDKSRDILAELKLATARHGIQLGFYYSIWDWHDPDFPDPATFPRYEQHMYAQLKELVDNYDPAVLWFDGEWATDRPNNPWTDLNGDNLEAYVRALSPRVVVNNRVGKRRVVDGDTGTPEQEIPSAPVPGQLWESCMTLNGSWGFTYWDTDWKSANELTRNLVSIAARSGNYLLNVGPDANGRIPSESLDRLRQVGGWLRVNGEAVYNAQTAGIVAQPSWGAVSRHDDKLYVSVFAWPLVGGSLVLDTRVPFSVRAARVLGSLQHVDVVPGPGSLTITPLGVPTNDIATVLELTVQTDEPAGAAAGQGLRAQFWPNAQYSGDPTVSRIDSTINYDWQYTGSPDAALAASPFSSRWSGEIESPYSETYTFTTVSDDTVRLWVDGQLIVDNSTPHGPAANSGTIALLAGTRHAIAIEHSQQAGEASLKLLWSSPNIPQQIVPAVRLY